MGALGRRREYLCFWVLAATAIGVARQAGVLSKLEVSVVFERISLPLLTS
jgi:hypothetical protein